MRNSWLEIMAGLMVTPRLSSIITHGLFAMFLLCAWSFSASGLLTSEVFEMEVQALMSIKALLKDPHGALKNWDKDAVDPCTWTMGTYSSENLVISLEAPSQNLSRPLSPSIGNLTNLVTVCLPSNNMSGTIPPEIGNLSSLKTLDLSNNHFYGDIPASLGYLQSLVYLKLSNNSISGAFPVSALNLSQLIFLHVLLKASSCRCIFAIFLFLNLHIQLWCSIVGNPLICGAGQQKDCLGIQPTANLTDTQSVPLSGNVRNHKVAVAFGSSIGCISFLLLTDLANAGATKRATCYVLVMTKPAKGELEAEVKEKLQSDYDQITSEVVDLTLGLY
ncbi:hypothetical protein FCM35_KLT02872 [Carex littledalei]|uniref:Leucine-rich repeat-containing N-terminal plant-type domain-containing protein n=1 Tax=Carex littledalei TaxID=544730 RepID=A0A833VAV3_9POAL|nr:hypothetical protein FCM35_KLT02872 [Carex littledalei]